MEKLQGSDARYAKGWATRRKMLDANCTILGEVAYEAAVLLSVYAPPTIEAQIPVFTTWAANALKESMALRKKNS